MDFLLFQILFAVLVIALAISGWVLLRSLRERRAAKTQGWTPPPRAPRISRKSAPEPVAEPERVRKRQLVPLAALEAASDGEEAAFASDAPVNAATDDPASDAGDDRQTVWTDSEAVDEPGAGQTNAESAPEPVAAIALVHGETMELLEDAFVRLQRQEITLEDYCDLIAAQERALADRLAMLSATDDPAASAARDDTLAAQDAVRWCRKWADDLVREAAGDPPPT